MTEKNELSIESVAAILAEVIQGVPIEGRGALLITTGQALEKAGEYRTATVLVNAGAMHQNPGLSRALEFALKMKGR